MLQKTIRKNGIHKIAPLENFFFCLFDTNCRSLVGIYQPVPEKQFSPPFLIAGVGVDLDDDLKRTGVVVQIALIDAEKKIAVAGGNEFV